jgi:hypothetical protein
MCAFTLSIEVRCEFIFYNLCFYPYSFVDLHFFRSSFIVVSISLFLQFGSLIRDSSEGWRVVASEK